MRRHQCVELASQLLERHQIVGANLLQAAFVLGDRHVGIRLGPAMSGEMLAGRRHARRMHATGERAGQLRSALRVALEGTAADHRAALVIEVEHRREAQVQSDRQHFGRHQPAALLGQALGIGIVSNGAHRRQAHEALAQSLHPTPFLVDCQQQVRALGANGRAEFTHLTRVLDVAGEDDQAAHLGLAQDLAVLGGQPGAADVEHQRALHMHSLGDRGLSPLGAGRFFDSNRAMERHAGKEFQQIAVAQTHAAV
ncbi:hypothetical protein D3C81_1027740 [compost metagenome]